MVKMYILTYVNVSCSVYRCFQNRRDSWYRWDYRQATCHHLSRAELVSNSISQTASQPTNMATTNSSSKHTSPSTDMAILDSNPHHTLLLTLSNNTHLDPITTHLYISTHLAFSELVSFTYKAFCYHVCYPGPDCFAIVLGFEIPPVLFFAVCQLPEFLSVL